MAVPHDLPVLSCASRDEWLAWLDAHHGDSPGVWLKMAKAKSGVASVTYADALDGALCYGWIDSQKARLDDTYWLQRFTPRRSRSVWSKINRDKVQALIDSGEMRPAGLREVEQAKADGRWDAAYEGQRTADVPDDLAAALAADPGAAEFWSTLDRANRYAILHRLQTAKKPENRARRIEKFVAMLAAGEKLHP